MVLTDVRFPYSLKLVRVAAVGSSHRDVAVPVDRALENSQGVDSGNPPGYFIGDWTPNAYLILSHPFLLACSAKQKGDDYPRSARTGDSHRPLFSHLSGALAMSYSIDPIIAPWVGPYKYATFFSPLIGAGLGAALKEEGGVRRRSAWPW